MKCLICCGVWLFLLFNFVLFNCVGVFNVVGGVLSG